MEDSATEVLACRRCGTREEVRAGTMPLTWSSTHDGDLVRFLCTTCTRDHVRDIEAKLADDWWR